jgi:hypothetical protein
MHPIISVLSVIATYLPQEDYKNVIMLDPNIRFYHLELNETFEDNVLILPVFSCLEFLDCSFERNIRDLNPLKHLKKLLCYSCPNLTMEGIQELSNLTELDCSYNDWVTNLNSMKHLTKLSCYDCPNLTLEGIEELNLEELHCDDLTWKRHFGIV